ncbi:MAG: hypothetical protein K9N55_15445, partial [Phycisphaerae bacterium]|nr:hypothetical protein [Phycisphaerae bacterium]
GGGLSVVQSDLAVTNCLFENNEAEYGAGLAGRYRVHAQLTHCTFHGNHAPDGAALYMGQASVAVLKNCILWDDANEISLVEDGSVDLSYSDIQDRYPGQGNISMDPLFAEPGCWALIHDPNTPAEPNDPNALWIEGDYHLKSENGRWDSVSASWVVDAVTSPCIDAGDPNSSVALEPFPNGCRVNMGAYGSTVEASKTVSDLVSGTHPYEFLSDQSTLIQTGGFAGVLWTHIIHGQFVLDIESDGSVSFLQVDASAVDRDVPDRVMDVNTALNLIHMTGVVDCNDTLRFKGETANETTVHLEMRLEGDLAYLTGWTTPPPGSADFFILNLDAVAQRK